MKIALRSKIERARRAASLVIATLTVAVAAWSEQPATAIVPGANGKIAFTSSRDGNQEVYVMNADGSGQTNITHNIAHDIEPDWGVGLLTPTIVIENIIVAIHDFDPPLQPGMANSLVSKLENAVAALKRANTTAARNILEAFINEVEAQACKSITDEQAAGLVAAVSEALAALE